MARSVIPWFGGKHRLAPKIIQFIPDQSDDVVAATGGRLAKNNQNG